MRFPPLAASASRLPRHLRQPPSIHPPQKLQGIQFQPLSFIPAERTFSSPSSTFSSTSSGKPWKQTSKPVTTVNMAPPGKITDWVKPGDKTGEYRRQASTFRRWISPEPGAEFPPEKGRYHLYVSYACPWAQRTLLTRRLKGLEEFVSFSVLHWHMVEGGWRFATKHEEEPAANVIVDPIEGHEAFTHIRDVYRETEKDYDLRVTVPVLYDKKTKQIVNNESGDIVRMFGSAFDGVIDEKYRSVDLYPEPLRAQIDETNAWLYDNVNNCVYKAGFATVAETYEKHVLKLFEALDKVEKHLAERKGKYYFGDALTETDIRLWVTIVRFDVVYVQHFKCNLRDIRSGYPHLHRWLRELYWKIPAFKETTRFDHIKLHYTKSHTQINPYSITPVGPLPHILPLDEEVAAARQA